MAPEVKVDRVLQTMAGIAVWLDIDIGENEMVEAVSVTRYRLWAAVADAEERRLGYVCAVKRWFWRTIAEEHIGMGRVSSRRGKTSLTVARQVLGWLNHTLPAMSDAVVAMADPAGMAGQEIKGSAAQGSGQRGASGMEGAAAAVAASTTAEPRAEDVARQTETTQGTGQQSAAWTQGAATAAATSMAVDIHEQALPLQDTQPAAAPAAASLTSHAHANGAAAASVAHEAASLEGLPPDVWHRILGQLYEQDFSNLRLVSVLTCTAQRLPL